MTVIEFLKTKTNLHELCIIREAGWNCQSVYIDRHDSLLIHSNIANRTVISSSWEWLEIASDHNTSIKVKCHYIDT